MYKKFNNFKNVEGLYKMKNLVYNTPTEIKKK